MCREFDKYELADEISSICQSDSLKDFLLDDLQFRVHVTKMMEGSGRNKTYRAPEEPQQKSSQKLSVITIRNNEKHSKGISYKYA